MAIYKRKFKTKSGEIKKSKTYWYHFMFEGQHVQKSTKQGNPRVARQIEAAFKTKLAKGEVGLFDKKRIPSLASAVRGFLDWSKQNHQSHPATYRRYVISSKPLLKHFADIPLDRITPQDVERYKSARLGQTGQRTKREITPATANRELACLKAVFNHAIKDDVPVRNPVSRVKFLPENNEQTRVLTFIEQRQYLGVASPTLRDVAVLMLETGMRPEEVYRIRGENVHLEEGFLYNPYGKTKAARRKITLTGAASEVLKRRMAPVMFPHRKDHAKPMVKANNAHDIAVRKSGIAPFRLYDLRHTWATRAAESGIDLVTLAAMLGHSRIQMVLRYAHPSERHQAQSMKKLEEFTAAKQIAEYEKIGGQSLHVTLQ